MKEIEMSIATYASMWFKKIMLSVDGMCESEIEISLCESSATLYVWNVFPMQFFLMKEIETSIATYASMWFKKIMLSVDGMCESEIEFSLS